MSKNIVLYAVLGVVGFVLYKQISAPSATSQNPQLSTSNPSGGSQVSAPDNVMHQVLGIVGDIFSTAKTVVAQNAARNT